MIAITRIVPNVVGYLRVSTDKQGRNGLGMEAQRAALYQYASQTGATILRIYVEVESGRRPDRPELTKALAHAKRSRATLEVAKLDRLSRNVAFLAAVMDSGADFVACDNPHANRLTLHILAAVAEAEALAISQRTKAALAAAKARGVLLGASNPKCRKLDHDARKRGAKRAGEVVAAQAREAYADLVPLVTQLRSMGLSQAAIADKLNEQGHTTRTGRPFSQPHVRRVLAFAI
jgi:DNA invertase Pin-like site-specific DNA recombinase